MKPRITHLLCTLISFGLCSLQGYARDGAPELEVLALIREVVKYHPDKVATLGPDVQKAAEDKFKEVLHAYEAICKERCM